jgi:hypothetical protein
MTKIKSVGTTNADKDVEKLNHSYIGDRNVEINS